MPNRLIDVADIVMGTSPPGESCNAAGIGEPLLNGPTEFGPHHPTPVQYTIAPRRFAEPGDILFCVRGSTTGRMNWADRGYAIGRGVAAIRHLQGTKYQPFLRAAIEHGLAQLLGFATGSTFPSLSRDDIGDMPLPEYDLPTQAVIATIIGALDDKIEQNRITSQALERLAQAIFKAWFVDFEPVKAKAAGERSFPGMPQAVFDALPTRFVDSEIGPIPKGWDIGAVSDTCDLSRTQLNPQNYPDEVFDHFSIPAFDDDRKAAVDEGRTIKSNKFLVVANCILSSKLNPRIHRSWLPPPAGGRRQIASTEFLIVVPREGWDRDYLYCQLQEAEFRDSLAQSASGTSNSHQRLRPQDFLAKRIVLPPEPWRVAFRSLAGPLMQLWECTHNESQKLAELRDLLLPKLLSGKLRATDVARAVERRL